MAQDWFLMVNGQQVGPVSPQQMREMAASGQLQPTDTVWKEGMPNWVPASSVKGLPFAGGAIAPGPAPSGAMAPVKKRPADAASSGGGSVSTSFSFDGTANDFFVVGLLCIVFSLIPLVGYFLAICNYQRWRCEHTMIQGRRLKFTGQGMDMFIAMIVPLILTICTCYIYMFWFIPKINLWITEHTDFADA